MAVALLIVGTMAGVLTAIIASQGGETRNAEARIAGWQAVQIARAARLHVRDAIENPDSAFPSLASNRETVANAIQTGVFPDITVQDLIDDRLLPPNFARGIDTNADTINDVFFNALGQEIEIIIANYPIGGDPALDTTVPTAFVYFKSPSGAGIATKRRQAKLTQDIVQGVRAENAPVAAPLFEITPTLDLNLSGACNTPNPSNSGGDAVVIWDSGCLDTGEFTALTGETFEPGSFVLPVWRTVNFDTRALMRFPQPEQTDLHTMQTDLEMAQLEDCDADDDGVLDQNLISIRTDSGTNNTNLCSAIDDDRTAATDQDRRLAILDVNNLQSANLIIDPQTNPGLEMFNTTPVVDTGDDLIIGGNLTAMGDAKIFDGNSTVRGQLNVDRNIIVSGTGSASARAGSLTASGLNSDNATVNNAVSITGNISISGATNNIGTLRAGGELITQTAESTSNNPTIDVTNNANILQASAGTPLNLTSDVTVKGNNEIPGTPALNNWSTVAARIQVNNDALNINNLSVDASADINATATSTMTEVTNSTSSAECFGDCPRRTIAAQCNQLIANGVTVGGVPLTFSACMAAASP